MPQNQENPDMKTLVSLWIRLNRFINMQREQNIKMQKKYLNNLNILNIFKIFFNISLYNFNEISYNFYYHFKTFLNNNIILFLFILYKMNMKFYKLFIN